MSCIVSRREKSNARPNAPLPETMAEVKISTQRRNCRSLQPQPCQSCHMTPIPHPNSTQDGATRSSSDAHRLLASASVQVVTAGRAPMAHGLSGSIPAPSQPATARLCLPLPPEVYHSEPEVYFKTVLLNISPPATAHNRRSPQATQQPTMSLK